MSITYVVQARMGSTRLPGKVMADVGGMPLIGVMLRRLEPLSDGSLVVATSTQPGDDPIEEYCTRRSVAVVRGSESDVLGRFIAAVERFPATTIVRLTADCPLADPALVTEAVALHHRSGAAYTSNTLVRTYPDGLDVEVIAGDALHAASEEATRAEEREHVTPFVYRRPERFRLAALRTDVLAGDERWTVDHAEDLDLIRTLVDRQPGWAHLGWEQILAIVGRRDRPPSNAVRLRPASPTDSDRLLQWRNDAQTVRFALSGRTVGAAEHEAWLARILTCPASRIWLGEVNGVPVGQVRIDVVGGIGTVSLAVAPEQRGHGYGAQLLSDLLRVLRADYQVIRLVAVVHQDNTASLRLFDANGFRSEGRAGRFLALAWTP